MPDGFMPAAGYKLNCGPYELPVVNPILASLGKGVDQALLSRERGKDRPHFNLGPLIMLQMEVSGTSCLRFPLFASRVPAGFPSPADDYVEASLDLNKHLIDHPAATFFVRVLGDSMIRAGIHNHDILVVDRSLEPKQGSIIIAVLNGEFTVQRLCLQGKEVTLKPENPEYPDRCVTEDMDFLIWGVVTSVIHQFNVR